MPVEEEARRLFVYGTLRRAFDGPEARALRRGAVFLGQGWVRGRLVDLGGYPGLVRVAGAGRVAGEMYHLRDARLLKMLDDYENCAPDGNGEYRRERLQVVLRHGGRLRAWSYVLNRSPEGLPEVMSGDWVAWVGEVE